MPLLEAAVTSLPADLWSKPVPSLVALQQRWAADVETAVAEAALVPTSWTGDKAVWGHVLAVVTTKLMTSEKVLSNEPGPRAAVTRAGCVIYVLFCVFG